MSHNKFLEKRLADEAARRRRMRPTVERLGHRVVSVWPLLLAEYEALHAMTHPVTATLETS
ncbi:hypothetical protein ACWDKQ_34215 [Saccharopolyspora sp. NPDC000995]